MKKLIFFLLLLVNLAKAQDFMPLYAKGKIPNSKGTIRKDSIANERIFSVATPGMYCFFPSKQENKRAAVLICPGGGYERLAYVISGTQLAKWFNTMGMSAFVLNYRLPNDPDLVTRDLAPLQDAQRAIKLIRQNAEKWGINPNQIGIQGSSAGGHLASLVGTTSTDVVQIGDELDNMPTKVNFMILVSPVIDMQQYAHKGSRKNLLGDNPSADQLKRYTTHLQVDKNTAIAFITAAFNDKTVDVHNSLLLYEPLLENKVPSSLHLFPQGAHAIALRNNPGSTELWTNLCEAWLIEMEIIPRLLKN